MNTLCICGGGSLGHVIAGVLSEQQNHPLEINLLTNRPFAWNSEIEIITPDKGIVKGNISKISSDPKDVIPQSDVILICLPGHLIKAELQKIKSYLSDGAYVGCVFSSTGFFFEALEMLNENIKLWGFQRVPYIARIVEYGHSANLLGYKLEHKIAVERVTEHEKESFRIFIEGIFNCPTKLLNNYLEASITNSNPLLHTSRLFSMFKDWRPGVTYPKNYLFYEEWTEEAADLYIKMDAELADLINMLPVSSSFLPRVLDYYESSDAVSLRDKLSSIDGFKGIQSPMIEVSDGQWIPDFRSRYFVEDFGYGLKYIYGLMEKKGIEAPIISEVYRWGARFLGI